MITRIRDKKKLSGIQKRILIVLLQGTPVSADEFARSVLCTPAELHVPLRALQMRDFIQGDPPCYFKLTPKGRMVARAAQKMRGR